MKMQGEAIAVTGVIEVLSTAESSSGPVSVLLHSFYMCYTDELLT